MTMKTANTIYHVMPTGARWKVIGEGTTPSYHTTEAEAVSTAREWAMTNEPSHVVIHKIDGSIEEEHLMKMDSFPHAPSGSIEPHTNPAQRPSERTERRRDRNAADQRSRQDGYSHRNGASY
jgi:hypothetical protein